MVDKPEDKLKEKKKEKVKPLKKLLEPVVPKTVTQHMDEIMRRLRLLEERYSGLRKKTQFTEQNMLSDTKELTEEINVLHEIISELKNDTSDLNEKLLKLSDEVKGAVSKADFNVLSKYMEVWEPMEFLTRKQAQKLIIEYKKIVYQDEKYL